MALIKEIELANGITVTYHRVVSINKITNVQNIIEIASYVSKAKRLEEKNAIENNTEMNVFISTEYLNTEYNETIDISNIYEYLKTLDKFNNAEDDIEEGGLT